MKSKLVLAAMTGLVMATTSHAAEKSKPKPASTPMGECYGMNECKGKGECGGQGHACAGSNTCKGQGWVTLNEKDCTSKKGTWKAAGSGMADVQNETPKTEPTKKGVSKPTPSLKK